MTPEKQEAFKTAFDEATVKDLHDAVELRSYGEMRSYPTMDIICAAVRYGFNVGKTHAKARAAEANRRLHDYLGSNDRNKRPVERIISAAKWIDDPLKLLEMAAYLEKCAKLRQSKPTPRADQRDTSADQDAKYEQAISESKIASRIYSKTIAADDMTATEIDVYSNGNKEDV